MARRYRDLWRDLQRREQTLDNLLLYIDFYPNDHGLPAILMKDGALVVLFALAGLDYEGFAEDEREQFSYYVRSALEQLPDDGQGFMLGNLLVRGPAELPPLAAAADANAVVRFVQDRKQEFWQAMADRSFQNRVVCSLRYFEPGPVQPSWDTLIADRKRFEFIRAKLDDRLAKLHQGFLTLQAALERFGCRPLDRAATFRQLYRLVNLAPPPAYRPDLSLNAQLGHSAICFRPESVIVNETTHVALVGVKYPPPGTVALYLRRFYELGFPLLLKQTFGFAARDPLWKRLGFNQNIARSLAAVDKTCALYVDEVAEFQRRVEADKELPLHWTGQVAVYADSAAQLTERTLQVQTLLKEIGAAGLTERHNLRNGFFALLPGHERLYLRRSLLTTANAGDLLSAYTLYGGDPEPVEYFQDRLNGVFAYDPFTPREKAHHLCITGPTGSGKSFAVNKLLLSSLVHNPYIYVIDLKQSFVEFFEFLREEMPEQTALMTVSRRRTDFRFNPFLLADLAAPVPEPQLHFCLGLVKLMLGEALHPGEEWDLLAALKLFFEKYRVLLRNQRDGAPIPPLTLLANTVERHVDRRDLAKALRIWTVGRKGEIFNAGTDRLQLARYCYFDLADLENEPELLAVLVTCIFAKIQADITDPAKQKIRKYLFCDEAHLYLHQSPEMAAWLEQLFRTGRHHHLLVGVVTQSIRDLLRDDAPWVQGVLENIRQAFFFNGQKGIESAFATFGMTDFHIEQYYQLKPEAHELLYWSAGGLRRILRPVTDPHTYWLATTDARERALRREVKARCGGDVRRAADACVEATRGARSRSERVRALEAWLAQTNPETQPLEPIVNVEAL